MRHNRNLREAVIDVIEETPELETLIGLVEDEFEEYPDVVKGIVRFMQGFDDHGTLTEDGISQVTNLLSTINAFLPNQMEALQLAAEDQGTGYFEDTVDIINRGDYLYFPGVEDDSELGEAYVDMIGSIKDAVSEDQLPQYIDIDAVAEMYEEFADEDSDFADAVGDMDAGRWYEFAEEQVADFPENFIDYFDYDAFGRELHMTGGYYFGDLGAIAIF